VTEGSHFKQHLAEKLSGRLQARSSVLAAWEGGSAANGTSDQYSDLDFNVLISGDVDAAFQVVEETLRDTAEITHIWHEPKSLWPDLTQKVYFLRDSPKHFFVDVTAFPESKPSILDEFMQTERHGTPVVFFDRTGRIRGCPIDKSALLQKQRARLREIVAAFPVYRTEVFKELDRGNSIDAFAFYQAGMLRPLIEVMGMIFRPHRFDFGLRYLKRSLPDDKYKTIEQFFFIERPSSLRSRAIAVDELFCEMLAEARRLTGSPSE